MCKALCDMYRCIYHFKTTAQAAAGPPNTKGWEGGGSALILSRHQVSTAGRASGGTRSGGLSKVYLQAHVFHLQQCFGIAAGVVDGVVRMLRFAEVLEIHEGVFLQSLVERTEVR